MTCNVIRPADWLPHHFALLSERVAKGMTIDQACQHGHSIDQGGSVCFDLPTAWVLYRGIVSSPDLMALFRAAMEGRIWAMADEIMAIADDSRNDWLVVESRGGEVTAANSEHIQRSKLRIETRLKLMGKLLPHVFGDAPPLSPPAASPDARQLTDIDRARAVAAILRKGQDRRVAELAQLAGVERAP